MKVWLEKERFILVIKDYISKFILLDALFPSTSKEVVDTLTKAIAVMVHSKFSYVMFLIYKFT